MLTSRTVPVAPAEPLPYPSAAQVRARLLALPFPDYAACVARLLTALGYRNVRLMGAMREKGRNAFGGMDLSADQGQGLTASKVIAQVKQYADPVPRAFVDELRGTMLRVGAAQGILVTTSEFARSAAEAALSGQHAAPVRLVDGYELARLLVTHRVDLEGRAWSEFVASDAEEPGQRFGGGIRRAARGPAFTPPVGQSPIRPDSRSACLPLPPSGPGVTVTVTVRAQDGKPSGPVAARA